MNLKSEWKWIAGIAAGFLVCFYLPVGTSRFDHAVLESLHLARWYAEEHVLLCLVPAFLIAGAVGAFVQQAAVMRYLGADAPKPLAYGVASVSGTILAVCSCTVLPLFAGIYRMGAGLGPAISFLYSGPAINVLAIILTARVLGLPLGLARAVGAILFSLVIGLLMQRIFRNEDAQRIQAVAVPEQAAVRPLWQVAVYFATMIAILVFANWGDPGTSTGFWAFVFAGKWLLTAASAASLALVLALWFNVPWWKVALATIFVALIAVATSDPRIPFAAGAFALVLIAVSGDEALREWMEQSWGFAKLILPLLLLGVLAAGFLLGRPGEEGLIPSAWVAELVGGNSPGANFFASVVGAFMYFATLTEVPILQGLMGSGMGKGPALALLLAGPALSLPSMLVIRGVLGTKKTAVYVLLVIVMATLSGLIYGNFPGA